ncbi:MAG: aspartate aminotransferase family protein [Proteobacteria bacterium]|nr:aspartate aminotransferase family protein [Pseudomonadota bacterium]
MISALMPTYARYDVAFERGEGAHLFATDGRRFLDFGAGIAVCSLGHCHPRLIEALTRQAGLLWHTSNLYRIPEGVRLADRLVANTFADSVFFTNSGAEAVECGLKMIRKFHDENGMPDRYRVICAEGAFHGRTLATISAGGQEKILKGFGPAVDGFDHVPFENLNALRAAITPQTAAILVEPVQGEGGMRVASVDYLRALREVADEFGLVLMFDEVQCGMGRTGKLFAHEWAGVLPDVIATAKALGGGFPVGACLARAKFASALSAGSHGSTFGGNPLAMAVGNAVLDVMLADGFLETVLVTSRKLLARLEELVARHPKLMAEVRGQGLMLGLKAVVPNGDLVKAFFNQGLLAIPAGDNVVRLIPPLIINERHIEEAGAMIERACKGFALAGA